MTKSLADVGKLEVGPKMEEALNAFKNALDAAVISIVTKNALREEVNALTRKILDVAKAAAGANKAKAVDAATGAVAAAVASGAKFAIVDCAVGSDTKALSEAIGAAMKASPTLPTLLVSADAAKDKLCVYAGVPKDNTAA